MLSNFNPLSEATSLASLELHGHFRKKYFFQYFLKSTNFPPSNNFFQLGSLRHAIPCSAPFLGVCTLNISSMAENGDYQESGTGPPSPEVVHEFLKAFMLFAIFTESGKLFHGSATLTGQKFLLTSPFHFRMSTF